LSVTGKREIKVDYIARVEGEGGLDVEIKNGKVERLFLRIFEPPRFFQGFLVGQKYDEVPEITSRICGICPVAHQITSIQAIEDAFGIKPDRNVEKLRRLLALSQWIQSHSLHIYMLAAPDFLGVESVLALAQTHPDVVKRALSLKRLGNDLTVALGGREVHPVTPTINGFTSLPQTGDLMSIRERLDNAMEDAFATVHLVSSFPIPDFSWDTEHVALKGEGEYPVNRGRLVSDKGLSITAEEYRVYIKERHVAHSNALHSYIEGREEREGKGSFLVGPLARLNLNLDNLGDAARRALAAGNVRFPSHNPFHGAMARAIELVQAIDDSISLIDSIDYDAEMDLGHVVRKGQGFALTEAPRGTLYHSYVLDQQGIVEKADIVSPTAHNVNNIEEDLRRFIPRILDLPLDEATLKCEMVVRNYDPCISCSAHFIKLNLKKA